MSTRGAFILAKGNVYKELYIWSDAYPDYAGRDVLRMIKTVDLNRAFDNLIPCESGKKPDGEDAMYLSLSRVEDAAGTDVEPQYFRTSDPMFIYDSISCEYGYLADLEHNALEFYTGGENELQVGNRFGEEKHTIPPANVQCYPCRLRAVISFHCIKSKETADLVKLLEKIRDEKSENVITFDMGFEYR